MDEAWQRAFIGSGAERWPVAISGLETARSRIIAAGAWTAGPATLMDVIGATRNEVIQCRVLRWLLDPIARHGLGSRLIADLADEFDIAISAPERVRVSVEITRDDTRADIVIDGVDGGRCVVIEAKIDAGEGGRQCDRIETHWPDASHLLFLTVGGERLPATASSRSRWQAVSWAWFAARVKNALANAPTTNDPRAVDARRAAADWFATIERHIA
jgi:hypothetical protein